mmetsp:Transcript_5636/g.7622  ORF Transcript_5636/g.7622 Transcript_5636/m.7622 type:complete len:129 (+) Transcript_5636:398-784(+)
MSWKHGHGNRDNLNNRSNMDPESGLMFRRSDEDLDGEIESLRGKITLLKSVSSNIGEEVSMRNKIISDLENTISKAQSALKGSMRTLNKMYKEGSSANHMTVIVVFVFCIFLLVYFWMRANRFIGYLK